MKNYKYLLALSLLGLAACSTDPGSSVPASSTPVDPGTSSVSSSEADERANDIIAAVKSLGSNPYAISIGENKGVVTDSYFADQNGGILELESYSRLHEKLVYPFTYSGASVDLGLAMKDDDGNPIEDVRSIEPEFENVDVSSIAGLEYGTAVVSDEDSLLYKALAYNSEASGLLRVSLSSDGKITASYGSGLSVVYSEVGTAKDERVEAYLSQVGLPSQTVGQTNYVNFVGGNVYNGEVSVYEVGEGADVTLKDRYSIVETNDAVLTIGTTEGGAYYPVEAVVRGEDGLAYDMVPEYNEDGTLKSYELTKRLDEIGAEVAWNDIPRSDNAFDIGGFRKIGEAEADTIRYDFYHYYGWEAEESYEALVPVDLPLTAELADIDLVVNLPVEEPYNGYVSTVAFETDSVINENYEEVTYLVQVMVAEEPVIYTLDDFVEA